MDICLARGLHRLSRCFAGLPLWQVAAPVNPVWNRQPVAQNTGSLEAGWDKAARTMSRTPAGRSIED